ncbi:MAG: ComEC/Rec2 family competence protein [Candidatus Omnitrophica bacterium]|nr:ComEC/Rec2 family competence protein [Candidatus Omnitrophota bacterium]
MNRFPLGIAALAFIAGIFTARHFYGIPFFIFWAFSLLSLMVCIISFSQKKRFLIFLIASILFLGGAYFKKSMILPYNHVSNFTSQKGRALYIEGIISSDPVVKKGRTGFTLDARRLIRDDETIEICGKVIVKVFDKKDLLYGDRVLLWGKIYRVPYFKITKNLSYRAHLENKGIYSVLSVSGDSVVKMLERRRGNPFVGFCFSVRRRIKEMIYANMEPVSAGILSAIILGERSNIPEELRKILVQTGTVHIIAISGLHVGLVSFIILMVFKMLRLPRRLSYIFTCVILAAYCVLTGGRMPVVRVTIMVTTFFLGYVIMRQTNIYNVLSLAALLVLVFNPRQLFNISFQLSFVSVISIIYLSPKIKSLFEKLTFPSKDIRRPYVHHIFALFSGSLAAWLGLSPLIAYYFRIISFIAILANMIVVPYLSIVIGSGLVFVAAGFIYPPLQHIFASGCEAVIMVLIKLVSIMVKIPGAYVYLR